MMKTSHTLYLQKMRQMIVATMTVSKKFKGHCHISSVDSFIKMNAIWYRPCERITLWNSTIWYFVISICTLEIYSYPRGYNYCSWSNCSLNGTVVSGQHQWASENNPRNSNGFQVNWQEKAFHISCYREFSLCKLTVQIIYQFQNCS